MFIKAKTIDEYFQKAGDDAEALITLHNYVLNADLSETIKWGMPVYCLKNKNVVGIAAFKKYVGIWFYQGVYLKDEQKKLVNAQEGVTKAMRQWRFSSLKEIKQNKKLIIAYVKEATENQKQGKELKPEKKKITIPDEIKVACKEDLKFDIAFKALTPGKQKEYAEYIATAKREATKVSRLAKIKPMVKQGVGLHDKYK